MVILFCIDYVNRYYRICVIDMRKVFYKTINALFRKWVSTKRKR